MQPAASTCYLPRFPEPSYQCLPLGLKLAGTGCVLATDAQGHFGSMGARGPGWGESKGVTMSHLLSMSRDLGCIKTGHRASLVAQWLRIRLPTQGTQIRSLVWEDPTCRGATKPVCHNY